MEQPATAPPMVIVLSSGNDDRHEAHGEGPIDKLAERDSRFGDADAPIRVDLDDLVEVEQVDLLVGVLLVMNLGDLVRDDPLLPGERRCAFPPAKLLRDPRHLLGMSRVKHLRLQECSVEAVRPSFNVLRDSLLVRMLLRFESQDVVREDLHPRDDVRRIGLPVVLQRQHGVVTGLRPWCIDPLDQSPRETAEWSDDDHTGVAILHRRRTHRRRHRCLAFQLRIYELVSAPRR